MYWLLQLTRGINIEHATWIPKVYLLDARTNRHKNVQSDVLLKCLWDLHFAFNASRRLVSSKFKTQRAFHLLQIYGLSHRLIPGRWRVGLRIWHNPHSAIESCNHRVGVHLRQNKNRNLVICRMSWKVRQYHGNNREGGCNNTQFSDPHINSQKT